MKGGDSKNGFSEELYQKALKQMRDSKKVSDEKPAHNIGGLHRLNNERKELRIAAQARIISLILHGYKRKQVMDALGYSGSTLDRAFCRLDGEWLDLLEMNYIGYFRFIPPENIDLLKKAGFSYRQFRRLLAEEGEVSSINIETYIQMTPLTDNTRKKLPGLPVCESKPVMKMSDRLRQLYYKR